MPYADETKRRLHTAWRNILGRCENSRHPGYKDYGGRGITVCEEWHRFFPFYSWSLSNGYADKLTIDRIDNNKGYSPDNCRWVSQKANSRNRRNNRYISFKGETLCISEWAERLGMSCTSLESRLRSKTWSLEQALTIHKNGRPTKQPSFAKKVIQISKDGAFIKEWESISDASKALDIPSSNISRALKNNNYTACGFYWKYASKK